VSVVEAAAAVQSFSVPVRRRRRRRLRNRTQARSYVAARPPRRDVIPETEADNQRA